MCLPLKNLHYGCFYLWTNCYLMEHWTSCSSKRTWMFNSCWPAEQACFVLRIFGEQRRKGAEREQEEERILPLRSPGFRLFFASFGTNIKQDWVVWQGGQPFICPYCDLDGSTHKPCFFQSLLESITIEPSQGAVKYIISTKVIKMVSQLH